jgi:hypothetical protein
MEYERTKASSSCPHQGNNSGHLRTLFIPEQKCRISPEPLESVHERSHKTGCFTRYLYLHSWNEVCSSLEATQVGVLHWNLQRRLRLVMKKAPILADLDHQNVAWPSSGWPICVHACQITQVCGHVSIHKVGHLQPHRVESQMRRGLKLLSS